MNLLDDKLVRVHKIDGAIEFCTLPEIYSYLAVDQVLSFPALQRHQFHAWHAFLAQLAVLAIHHGGQSGTPKSVGEWSGILQNLTADYPNKSPWSLVIDDFESPAFMQCPLPKSTTNFSPKPTPDDLDILVTSKNHDLKQSIARNNNPEDWIFSIVNLQTMAGFLGAGNYGISRMNGGFSSRPCMGLVPADIGIGAHLFFDIRRMIEMRGELLLSYPHYFNNPKIALVWLEPWDGEKQIELKNLDPYYIEICRRVRLRKTNGSISAFTAATKKPRISAKYASGNLGDFWTPIDTSEGKAISVSPPGFTYKRLADLIFKSGKYLLPKSMQVPKNSSSRWRLVARGIAGGQGKTEGYYERLDIFLTNRTAFSLFKRSQTDALAELSQMMISEIAEVNEAMRFGIAVAVSGGKDAKELSKANRAYAKKFDHLLDEYADSCYFQNLDERYCAQNEKLVTEIRVQFVSRLIRRADSILDYAIDSVPSPAIRRYRSRTKAVNAFRSYLRSSNRVFSNDQSEIFEKLSSLK